MVQQMPPLPEFADAEDTISLLSRSRIVSHPKRADGGELELHFTTACEEWIAIYCNCQSNPRPTDAPTRLG
jgi:hypothetical protein